MNVISFIVATVAALVVIFPELDATFLHVFVPVCIGMAAGRSVAEMIDPGDN